MAKNTKVISLSVKPEHHEILREMGYKLNVPMSEIARRLLADFVDLSPETLKKLKSAAEKKGMTVAKMVELLTDRFPIDDDTVKPIILKIPLTVLGNKDSLRKWLNDKSEALITHLYP